jgi:hypothetical protein
MRGIVKGLLVAAAAATLAAPAAWAVAGESDPVKPMIIGGVNATETYSFMAHLSADLPQGGWGCGAALIRTTWIVTARHCVTGDNDAVVPASALSFRIGTLQENSGGTLAQGKRVIRQSGADTALVELTAPVVGPKPINIAATAPVGTAVRIIGWGCIKDPGCEGPDVLQQLDTSILADNTCGGGAANLCINNPEGWRGACYGDSGGPAVYKAGADWVLAGNTSGGTSAICGQGPSVYVDLPNQRSWIESFAGPDGGGTPPTGTPPTTPPTVTNLALNRPAKANQPSCAASESPAKAVDGRAAATSDKWCSGAGATKTLEVDLGANRALKRLVVKHAGAGGESTGFNTRNFVLETSTGGGVWSTAATVTGNTASTTTSSVNVTARWIRIATTDPVARIYELEAYTS